MNKEKRSKIRNIAIIVSVIIILIIGAVILLRHFSNRKKTYTEEINLQKIVGNYSLATSAYDKDLMVHLLFSQKELGVYTHDAERESTPALLFYNLKTNESSLKEIPIPERRTVVEEEISDVESIEIFYGFESVVLTDDYVVLSFTACKRRFKTDGSGELLYVDPHIYLYSREGEFVKDIRLEDSVKYDAVLEPYQHRLMADGEYIYALSCVDKISSATKEREREVFEGPDNPYPWILAIYDYDGKLLEEREVPNGSGLLKSPQGIILNDGTNLSLLSGLKEEPIRFAESYDYLIQSGDQEYLFCYRRHNGVFGYRSDTGKSEQIFKDDSEQMEMFDFAQFVELADSYYYEGSLYRSSLYNGSDRLFILKHRKDVQANGKAIFLADSVMFRK